MSKGIVVCLPPGAGKTRRVWENIIKSASKKKHIWRKRIRETLILTPNRYIHRIWLRELGLIAVQRGMLELPDGEDPRTMKLPRLKKILRLELALPHLDTFKRLKSKRSQKFSYLILDEWHRLPQYVIDKCDGWNKDRSTSGWFLNGTNIKHQIFFVSATPVNPVLEDEVRKDEIIEQPYENEDDRLKEALYKATCVIKAFTGVHKKLDNKLFFNFLKNAGIGYIAAGKNYQRSLRWKYPSTLNKSSPLAQKVPDELVEYLRNVIPHDESSYKWTEEYGFVTGLVRTRRRRKRYLIYPGLKCTGGRSFGIHYKHLFVEKRSSGSAENWLWEKHPRIRYLIEMLETAGLIHRTGNNIYEWGGNKKAVIFCVHQGVALGLVFCLRKFIRPGRGDKIVVTNVRNKKLEELIDAFNRRNSEIRILVATDALSESINLHENCKIVIHYELPWSPLRLLQRIGRLTRLKESTSGKVSFNKGVRVGYVIIPGSVEEERINRLVRRIKLLEEQRLWPDAKSWKQVTKGLLGSGPSLQLLCLLKERNR